jgi:hypothetical protein
MDIDRAIARLSLFSAVLWLIFWSWRYATGCIQGNGKVMFCPNAGGETLVKTDWLHMGLFLLLPPLCGFVISVLIFRGRRH